MSGSTETNRSWVAAALIGVLLALGIVVAWSPWKGRREAASPLRKDLEELGTIDPRLVIASESTRLPTGLAKVGALAVGPSDRIYVAGDQWLEIFESDGGPAIRHPLAAPATAMAVDADGTVYLALKDHIEVLDAEGEKKAAWDPADPSSWITSVALSADALYAADFGRRIVLRYERSGKLLARIGAKDPEKGGTGFLIPSPYFDVAVDPAGSLWVADTARHRLVNFRADGTPASSWGTESARIEGFSGCCNPSHFAIRRDGSFVTAEKGLVRIKIHGPSGKFLGVVAGPKDFPEGTVGLDVAVDSNGRILVLDPSTSAVRVYVETAARPRD
jgi:DNA-binding beta-propeller fold protein YncE